jgi:hypothetical protein
MIDAKELRIGNYIYINRAHGKGQKQKKVKQVNIHYLKELDFCEKKYIEPIPLMEEWLIKFGFVWNENGYFEKNHFKITDEMQFLFFNLGDWFKKINYVHELQNLYFSLTNQELTL